MRLKCAVHLLAGALTLGLFATPALAEAGQAIAHDGSSIYFEVHGSGDRFLFLGFLPRKAPERRRALRAVAGSPWSLVVFEAPRRLRGTLRDMLDALGDRDIAVCREMTKLHEEVYRGTISDALAHFSAPRGEFTLVVAGAAEGAARASSDEAREALLRLRAQGLRARESVAQVAEATGLAHRTLYRMWLDLPETTHESERE